MWLWHTRLSSLEPILPLRFQATWHINIDDLQHLRECPTLSKVLSDLDLTTMPSWVPICLYTFVTSRLKPGGPQSLMGLWNDFHNPSPFLSSCDHHASKRNHSLRTTIINISESAAHTLTHSPVLPSLSRPAEHRHDHMHVMSDVMSYNVVS